MPHSASQHGCPKVCPDPALAGRASALPLTADIHLRYSVYAIRDIRGPPTIGARALQAAQSYGRGVGHPARLNMGDCFAYACATAYRTSLVYVGNDFVETDLA